MNILKRRQNMTTNIKPIEAVEKIAKTLDTIIRVDKLKYADDALSVELVYMQNIATQALAPQEPPEKTFTVEEIEQLTQKLEKVTNQRNILNNELIKYGCLYLQGVGFLKELNT